MIKRGVYGVEWTASRRDEESSNVGWVVVFVVVAALVSLAWTLYSRYNARREDEELAAKVTGQLHPEPARAMDARGGERPDGVPAPALSEPRPPALSETRQALARRPVVVRNLLLRLEEAERRRDVEMAVSTIEQIRALPGAPAADLDDALARRLGRLNVRRLFDQKCALWVSEVTVKRGDSASRIASEHGSTFASLQKLNGDGLSRVKVGQKIFVLNHPRFNLVVHRRLRTADLQLNGKFFRRYDLKTEVKAGEGAYTWREITLDFSEADRAELDTLLPKTTSVLVSEL